MRDMKGFIKKHYNWFDLFCLVLGIGILLNYFLGVDYKETYPYSWMIGLLWIILSLIPGNIVFDYVYNKFNKNI